MPSPVSDIEFCVIRHTRQQYECKLLKNTSKGGNLEIQALKCHRTSFCSINFTFFKSFVQSYFMVKSHNVFIIRLFYALHRNHEAQSAVAVTNKRYSGGARIICGLTVNVMGRRGCVTSLVQSICVNNREKSRHFHQSPKPSSNNTWTNLFHFEY